MKGKIKFGLCVCFQKKEWILRLSWTENEFYSNFILGIIWQNWACLHWITLKNQKLKISNAQEKTIYFDLQCICTICSNAVPYIFKQYLSLTSACCCQGKCGIPPGKSYCNSLFLFLFVCCCCLCVCLLFLLFWRGGGRWVQFLSLPTSHPSILSPTVFNIKLFTYWYQKVIMMMMMAVIISTNTVENVVVYCGLMYCW